MATPIDLGGDTDALFFAINPQGAHSQSIGASGSCTSTYKKRDGMKHLQQHVGMGPSSLPSVIDRYKEENY